MAILVERLLGRSRVAAAALSCLCALPAPFQSDPTGERVSAAIESLRARAERGGGFFNPMHGWPSSDVIDLLDAREAATHAVCDELERLASARECRPDHSKTLYYVLGSVKDPASSEWIRQRIATDADEVYGYWLPCWQRGPSGPSRAERSWLKGAEQWSSVLRQLAASTDDPSRQLLAVEALGQWFHDQGTHRLFEDLRVRPDLDAVLCLAVECFFDGLGLPVDGGRIASAIKDLEATQQGREALFRYARHMRNEAFVPWLVSIAEDEVVEGSPRILLQSITLRNDLEPGQWADWYEANGDQGRDAWVKRYFDELLREHGTDPEAARARFHRDKFGMSNDQLVLLSLHRIAGLAEFQEDACTLVRWSNSEILGEELESIVGRVKDSGGACTCLQELEGPRVWLDDLPYPKGP